MVGLGNCCCTSTCNLNITFRVKCNGFGVQGAVVTVANPTTGATTTGTTDSSGNVSIPSFGALVGVPGSTWSYTVAKSGYTTYSGSFTFACGTMVIDVTFVHAGVTLSGLVYGCNGAAISGATVTAGTFGSTTTNGSGAWSIFVATSNATFNLTISNGVRYEAVIFVVTVSCGFITVASGSYGNVSLNPATGYQCISCCNFPVKETLVATCGLWGTQNLYYDSGSGTWTADFDSVATACTTPNCRSTNPAGLYTCKLRVSTPGCGLTVKGAYCTDLSGAGSYVSPQDSGSTGTSTYAVFPPFSFTPYFNYTGGSVSCSPAFVWTATLGDTAYFPGSCSGYTPRTWTVTITE